MLAPLTLREWKMRSGISGCLAVASRAMNPARSAIAPAAKRSVVEEPQPSSAAGFTMV